MVIHDTKETIDFLKWLHPDGPWTLVTFKPKAAGACCMPDQTGNAEQFIQKWNGSQDLYCLIGVPKGEPSKQPEKSEMLGSNVLWVDIDPRPREDLEDERARIRALLSTKLPAGVPPPSLVVDSGRGYWGFWKLDARCDNPDLVERYNQTLAHLFGADNCHNINRVCRLPGTVNQKTGRTATIVKDLSLPDKTYRLDKMPPPVQERLAQEGERRRPEIRAARPIADLDELRRWKVPDDTLIVINHGKDPDKPDRFPSRSEAVHYVACELVRREVPEDVILGVLMDENFGISDSIYRQKDGAAVPKPEGYARRQIERAHDKVEEDRDPTLVELNKLHAVLAQEGGKTRVLSWETTELDYSREVPVLQSFDDFRNRYMNRYVVVPTEKGSANKTLGDWWLRHPERREYKALRFDPSKPKEFDGYLNLWRGFSVDPREGKWELMEWHIREVLASGDRTYAEYILNWCAFAVQYPDKPAEVALVFRGGRGTGKGVFARNLKRLFGQHGLQVTSPLQLTGRFNAHLRDCCLLFADEAIAPGDKAAESVLKGLITEPELTIEGKGVNAVQAKNRLHVVMASNEQWVVPAGIDERRFAVFDVAETHKQNKQYFAALEDELVRGGREAMLHALLHRPIDNWHPRYDVPKTAALQRQKELSLPPLEQFLLGALESGEIAAVPFHGRRGAFFSNDCGREPGLYSVMRRSSPRLREVSDVQLSRALKEWGCLACNDGQARGWQFLPLAEMRASWDARFGPRSWPAPNEWAGAIEVRDDMPF